MSAERERVSGFGRLEDGLLQASDWYLWGPYLSERQRGTVREDYSPDGDAWSYLPHDHARSRAYRWGEDGLAGFSDIHQRLCLGLALWNGRDPILKERAYGLTGAEANHGEDVKEYWWYLDAAQYRAGGPAMTATRDAAAPRALPGSPFPLGAAPRDGGTNFAVASSAADAMVLCLFDDNGAETQIPLQEYDAGVWHGFVPGPGHGQRYGSRASGPTPQPGRGRDVCMERQRAA